MPVRLNNLIEFCELNGSTCHPFNCHLSLCRPPISRKKTDGKRLSDILVTSSYYQGVKLFELLIPAFFHTTNSWMHIWASYLAIRPVCKQVCRKWCSSPRSARLFFVASSPSLWSIAAIAPQRDATPAGDKAKASLLTIRLLRAFHLRLAAQ